jgi:hypothetical protein
VVIDIPDIIVSRRILEVESCTASTDMESSERSICPDAYISSSVIEEVSSVFLPVGIDKNRISSTIDPCEYLSRYFWKIGPEKCRDERISTRTCSSRIAYSWCRVKSSHDLPRTTRPSSDNIRKILRERSTRYSSRRRERRDC